jgi:hypothetical protein
VKNRAAMPLIEYGRLVDARHLHSARVSSRGGRRRNSPPDNARAEGFFESRGDLDKTGMSVLAKGSNRKTAIGGGFL